MIAIINYGMGNVGSIKNMNIYKITESIGQDYNHEVSHYLNNMNIYCNE